MARRKRTKVGSRVLHLGRRGLGPFHGPEAIVADLRRKHPGEPPERLVDRLVRLHCVEAAAQAAVSGVGGFFVLVVTLPLSLLAGGVIQARLANAVALVYGHDIDAADTRELVAHAVSGAPRPSAQSLLPAVPSGVSRVLSSRLGRRLGVRLLVRVGGAGAARLIPIAGAVLAAALDFGFTRAVADRAIATFRR